MLKEIATTLRGAVMGVRRNLDGIREQMETLREEREAVEIAPLPADELKAVILAEIDSAAERAKFSSYTLGLTDFEGFHPSRLAQFVNRKFAPLPNEGGARMAFDLLSAMFPDRMKELMTADLPAGGMTRDAKRKKLAEIDAKILALGIQEEILCREIDAATGAMIPRRRDADPAILLAPDAELRA